MDLGIRVKLDVSPRLEALIDRVIAALLRQPDRVALPDTTRVVPSAPAGESGHDAVVAFVTAPLVAAPVEPAPVAAEEAAPPITEPPEAPAAVTKAKRQYTPAGLERAREAAVRARAAMARKRADRNNPPPSILSGPDALTERQSGQTVVPLALPPAMVLPPLAAPGPPAKPAPAQVVRTRDGAVSIAALQEQSDAFEPITWADAEEWARRHAPELLTGPRRTLPDLAALNQFRVQIYKLTPWRLTVGFGPQERLPSEAAIAE